MSLNQTLIERIKEGKVILFLGSGALYGATLPKAKSIPLGNDLRDLICDRFLDGEFKSESLAHVSDLAESTHSLFDLQDYIKEYFSGLVPAEFHSVICDFNWRAIFTTNYDHLIETVYRECRNNLKRVVPILSNDDSLDITRKDSDIIPLIKLHGCISRTRDNKIPLILTVEQYNESLSSRKRLFNHLYELAYEYTIVFVGHSLQDANIRSVLSSLEKEASNGMRHYLLKPNVKQPEIDLWARKKITAIDITFENFLRTIESEISEDMKVLGSTKSNNSHPIKLKYTNNSNPSSLVTKLLSEQLDYLYSELPYEVATAEEFYSGIDLGWYPIAEGLAIKRSLFEELIREIIERPDSERGYNTELFCLKGEAGCGKTILLRQLAWEARASSVGVTLWVKDIPFIDVDALVELCENTNERLFIFWDNAAINSIEIYRTFNKLLKFNVKVTIITAERHNEWNMRCDDLDSILTKSHEIRYLSESEIKDLVKLLEINKCLGPNLINKSFEKRCEEFKELHGRQLLVALHEATMGKPFEDIIHDEYKNIFPIEAKRIYLTICTMNRLRLPVRAGLISRIHGICFDEFNDTLHKPLEKVVVVRQDKNGDYFYTARHSEIAEIVFNRALIEQSDRYQEYISIIRKLNTSYQTDKYIFRGMVKAKSLEGLFSDLSDVRAIYEYAQDNLGEDPYILQQMANYERLRPNGNLDKAIEYLKKAKEIAHYDSSIIHTLSVIWREKSKSTQDLHERRKYRAESRSFLDEIERTWGQSSHSSVTRLELLIDEFTDALGDDYINDKTFRDSIRDIQKFISIARQKFPNDSHISMLESKFADICNDTPNVIKNLENAFEDSDKEPFIAIRLSELYIKSEEIPKARLVLEKALERRRGNKEINFKYAELLRIHTNYDSSDLLYYYQRAFSPEDKNYIAKFWYARFAYTSGEEDLRRDATKLFTNLRSAKIAYDAKHEVRDFEYNVSRTEYSVVEGIIIRISRDSGFVKLDRCGSEIFMHKNNNSELLWDALLIGDRLSFNLGFTFSGPIVCDANAL
ncbi:P-loop NTPase [Vibrio parahaemolyticus]|uniref:P-loop NTPase n=3 Tax=Vibrio parahaemolyticus TaxID=670 RepID=UPI00389209A8